MVWSSSEVEEHDMEMVWEETSSTGIGREFHHQRRAPNATDAVNTKGPRSYEKQVLLKYEKQERQPHNFAVDGYCTHVKRTYFRHTEAQGPLYSRLSK